MTRVLEEACHWAINSLRLAHTRLRRSSAAELRWAATSVVTVLVLLVTIVAGKKLKRWYTCVPKADTLLDFPYEDLVFPAPIAFKRAQQLKRPPDACAVAVHLPQVALLFLTKGSMPHETMWKEWFAAAAGKLPRNAVRHAICERERPVHETDTILASCAHNTSQIDGQPPPAAAADEQQIHSVLAAQHLFDVWVHPNVGFPGYTADNVFYGRELPPEHRVTTVWGTHTLIDAERALLAAALTNPRAIKFVLVSESDVPLYSPLATYTQLIAETRSRLNACNTTKGWNPNEGRRFRPDMQEAGLHLPLWRKSPQWAAFTREHAESIVRDEVVDRAFRRSCRHRWDYKWCGMRVCYSDEHYPATLLAMLGADNQTDCRGQLTDSDWSRGRSTDPHPYEYAVEEVTPQLVRWLRRDTRAGCGWAGAFAEAARAKFIDAASVSWHDVCGADENIENGVGGGVEAILGPQCPLLARKFGEGTAAAVLAALLRCEEGGADVLVRREGGRCVERFKRHETLLLDAERRLDQILQHQKLVRAAHNGGAMWSSWRRFPLAAMVIIIGMGCIGATWAIRKRRKRRNQPLPLVHKDSFYSLLRSHGILE